MNNSILRSFSSRYPNKKSSYRDAENSAVGSIAKAYELALKQREFEISQLTSRNNFFMIFQGVLIAGLIQSGWNGIGHLNFYVCLAGIFISAFQTGIASGAKFWQIRWEAAVKELEIQLLEHLAYKKKVIQLFSVDATHLNSSEIRRLNLLNENEVRKKDKLSTCPLFFTDLISKNLSNKNCIGKIPNYLIKSRFSVSKIPIWTGIILLFFWIILWNYTFLVHGQHISGWIFSKIECFNFFNAFSFAQPHNK